MAKKKRDEYIREHDQDGTDIVSFHLVDAKTVERRMKEGDITLPKKKVDIPKDKRWNTKQLNSKLLAGILNGDSIPNIANSLMDVIGNNQAAATRNARTMVTGAENAGRKDSYKALEEQGVIQKKVWIATADDRTRESHLMLDGEEVDIDEPFSNGLMYPGDPSGEPEEVYNCRCTMRTHIVGIVRQDTGEYIDINTPHENAFHKQQIEAEEQRREDARPVPDEKEKYKISIPDAVQENFDKFADKYRNAKFEHTITCDANGNVLYQGGGKKGSVSTPIGVAYKSEGCHVMHNHTEDVVFSPGDVQYIEQWGLATSSITTPNNKEYIFENLNPKRKSEDDLAFFYAAKDAFMKIEEKTTDELREFRIEIMKTDLSREEKLKAIKDWMEENNTSDRLAEWYAENAKKYGFMFEVKKKH